MAAGEAYTKLRKNKTDYRRGIERKPNKGAERDFHHGHQRATCVGTTASAVQRPQLV